MHFSVGRRFARAPDLDLSSRTRELGSDVRTKAVCSKRMLALQAQPNGLDIGIVEKAG